MQKSYKIIPAFIWNKTNTSLIGQIVKNLFFNFEPFMSSTEKVYTTKKLENSLSFQTESYHYLDIK